MVLSSLIIDLFISIQKCICTGYGETNAEHKELKKRRDKSELRTTYP